MVIVVVVPFLNEARCLGDALAALDRQTRSPDRLLLVDDGSDDDSCVIAMDFARDRAYADVLHRAEALHRQDGHHAGLLAAAPLRAFQWAVEQIDVAWDIVAKVDADVVLPPSTLAVLEQRFESDPLLGMSGPSVSEIDERGVVTPYDSRPEHVEGMAAFYRRACYEDIAPLPAIPGWDTVDQFRARMRNWKTERSPLPDGNALHLRPKGSYDGRLRGFRRWGLSAYGYGSHPLHVLLYGARLMRTHRPRVFGGLFYLGGWAVAGLRRAPRAERAVLEAVRRDQSDRMRRRFRKLFR